MRSSLVGITRCVTWRPCVEAIIVLISQIMEKTEGNIVTELLGGLWEVWGEMWSAIIDVLPKVISFILWVLLAIIVLPCVFVAGEIFPMWVKWGEEM